MSKIDVAGFVLKKHKMLAKYVAEQVISLMNQPSELEVAIRFVSKKKIKALNNELRSINKVTDVLSFPSTNVQVGEIFDCNSLEAVMLKTDEGFVHFGDMALCFAQCKKQAKQFKVSVQSEIKKLVIHSMLHLMGYDHIKDDDYEIMQLKEDELNKKIEI